MYKGLVVYSVIPVVVFLAFLSAFNTGQYLNDEDYSVQDMELVYNSPIQATIEIPKPIEYLPSLGNCFVGFKEALAFKESQGNYFIVNTFGYLGKYQFGAETLKMIGIYNPNHFLNTPELQEKAFLAYSQRNKWILRKDIKRYVGKTIGGVKVTESGILAAAHLAGAGSVKKFLRSSGSTNFADGYGSTVKYYMKRFSGYNTSFVEANRKAKASI